MSTAQPPPVPPLLPPPRIPRGKDVHPPLQHLSLSFRLQRPTLPPSLGATGFKAFVSANLAQRNVRVSQRWVLKGIRPKQEGERGEDMKTWRCNTCVAGCKHLMPCLWRQTDRKRDTRGLRVVAYSLLCVRADCLITTTTQTQCGGGWSAAAT